MLVLTAVFMLWLKCLKLISVRCCLKLTRLKKPKPELSPKKRYMNQMLLSLDPYSSDNIRNALFICLQRGMKRLCETILIHGSVVFVSLVLVQTMQEDGVSCKHMY